VGLWVSISPRHWALRLVLDPSGMLFARGRHNSLRRYQYIKPPFLSKLAAENRRHFVSTLPAETAQ
jgi:hypothetical protein